MLMVAGEINRIPLDCYLRNISSYLFKHLYFWSLLLQQLSLYTSLPVGPLGQDLFQKQCEMERVDRVWLSPSL